VKFIGRFLQIFAAPPGSDFSHAVFLLDLNSFKHINDIYGHGIGDEVLINIALRLRRAVGDDDIVARFGGDEFAILARQLAGSEDATTIAMRVIRELEHPIVTGSIQHKIGASIGISLVPQDGKDDSEVLRKADIALYCAKERKPESFWCFFDADMDARIGERDLLERDLPSAVHRGAVQPYYQPLVDLPK
jgi:diguanylate cyclase (GGDEF)-like protein